MIHCVWRQRRASAQQESRLQAVLPELMTLQRYLALTAQGASRRWLAYLISHLRTHPIARKWWRWSSSLRKDEHTHILVIRVHTTRKAIVYNSSTVFCFPIHLRGYHYLFLILKNTFSIFVTVSSPFSHNTVHTYTNKIIITITNNNSNGTTINKTTTFIITEITAVENLAIIIRASLFFKKAVKPNRKLK